MNSDPRAAENDFSRELSERIEVLAKNGRQGQVLALLARAIQEELTVHPSHRNGQQVPHYSPIENMMRAIAAILDPEFFERAHDGGGYVSTNLRYVGWLAQELEERVPSFASAEALHDVPLSAITH